MTVVCPLSLSFITRIQTIKNKGPNLDIYEGTDVSKCRQLNRNNLYIEVGRSKKTTFLRYS